MLLNVPMAGRGRKCEKKPSAAGEQRAKKNEDHILHIHIYIMVCRVFVRMINNLRISSMYVARARTMGYRYHGVQGFCADD